MIFGKDRTYTPWKKLFIKRVLRTVGRADTAETAGFSDRGKSVKHEGELRGTAAHKGLPAARRECRSGICSNANVSEVQQY